MTDEMDEIWALYADDGAQALDAMETALAGLDGDAGDIGHVSALFRAVHTFKGNSRVLGLSTVESRAHLAEDLIGLVRDAGVPWDAEIRALMLETADALRSMLEQTATTQADVAPAPTESLMARLRDKIGRCQPAGPDEAAIPEPDPPQAAAPLPEPAPALPDPAPPAAQPAPDAPDMPRPLRLADDPTYRRIFDEMVAETITRLEAACDRGEPGAARRLADDLGHAATRLGLDDWAELLVLPAGEIDDGTARALAARLRAMAGLPPLQAPDDIAPAPPGHSPAPAEPPEAPEPPRTEAAPVASGTSIPHAAASPGADRSDLDPAFQEQLGEIAVSQSMVSGVLQDLANDDLGQQIAAALHGCDALPSGLIGAISALVEAHMQRVAEAATMAEQMSSRMAELQQRAADMRLRPASTILDALEARVAAATPAGSEGLTFVADDGGLSLDGAVLHEVQQVLELILLPRVAAAGPEYRQIALRLLRVGDHLAIEIEDTAPARQGPIPEPVIAWLDRVGADLQTLGLPDGSQLDMIAVPLPQVVLEGMAVRAGKTAWVLPLDVIRSLVQPEPGAILTVSAQRGRPMLRLSKDEIVPIYPLPGDRPDLSVPGRVYAVLHRMQQSVAVPVDELIGQQLVLVRPLRGLLSSVRHVSGMALLAGGDVGLVLAHTAIGGTDLPGRAMVRAA